MDEIKKLTASLEYLYLKQIINILRDKTTNILEVKRSAVEFLNLQPYASVQDAKNKMKQFAQKFSQFVQLEEYMSAYEEEKRTSEIIEKMKKHIKGNNLDEALRIASK